MRRTVRYTAGLIIAAGASLAFAGPAAAAPQPIGPGFNPFVVSAPTQSWVQSNVSQQTVLNNVGNPQIGAYNYNGGGNAGATNSTNQTGGQFLGGILGGL